jgi:hypothetical protein
MQPAAGKIVNTIRIEPALEMNMDFVINEVFVPACNNHLIHPLPYFLKRLEMSRNFTLLLNFEWKNDIVSSDS